MKVLYFNAKAGSNYNGTYRVPDFILNTIANKSPDIVILTEVIPIFREGDSYKFLKDNYTIHYSLYKQKEKNAVLIAVNKNYKIIDISYEVPGFSDDDKSPDYLNIHVNTNGTIYNIIGFRMITDEYNYDEERRLFDIFCKNTELNMENEVTLLIGDFNNAKHYGRLSQSFDDVEDLYWTQNWDRIKKRYYGERKKRLQYNYNLHIIKDLLSDKGLTLIENEADYSFVDRFGNQIHDDHFFISKLMSEKVSISFFDSDASLDHRYFEAIIED